MSDTPDASASVLVVRDLAKSYGATEALGGVSFSLEAGRVYGLIGVNGSGKSTLMKLVAGAERPSGGQMFFAGSAYRPRSVLHASRTGIGMVPQELPIVPRVSVADNVLLGRWPARFGALLIRQVRHLAAAALGRIGVRIDTGALAGELRLGEQQMTVIARTMAGQPQLVLMDEPTSALAGAEVERLRQVAREIAEQGRTVLFVSQRLDDVFEICDHVMVLRAGKLIASEATAALTPARAIELMLRGRAGDDEHRPVPAMGAPVPPADVAAPTHALVARRLTAPGLAGVDVEIDAGQIVGLAGLPGSGSSELLRALFGLAPWRAAELTLFDRTYRPTRPAAAIEAAVAYVTGDRQAEGLVPDASVATNIAMVRTRSAHHGPQRLASAQRAAYEQISALHIRPGDPDIEVRSLSGGNQQKVVFARWALAEPRLWLLDDATRGVDIGARHEIHDAIRHSVRHGAAALVVSSDVLELFEVCDHIAVFRAGTIIARLATDRTTPGEVEALTTGTLEAAS